MKDARLVTVAPRPSESYAGVGFWRVSAPRSGFASALPQCTVPYQCLTSALPVPYPVPYPAILVNSHVRRTLSFQIFRSEKSGKKLLYRKCAVRVNSQGWRGKALGKSLVRHW